ncbi:MAG: hypothetical protein A2Y15_01820 [Clostridiales bacterium GWF2_36_10]|nr:MAG: hypothetical protein A2Y15_01820 [Clostridiales bacterium GWF2_36_10]HAN21574.1 hypothetical protein [Clostridiales bacterium]
MIIGYNNIIAIGEMDFIMIEFIPVSFILPNRLAAVSAAINNSDNNNERIVACDGITNCLFIFNCRGVLLDTKEGIRSYRKLHYDFDNCRYMALSGNDNRRVYFLNCCFVEVGSVDLDIDNSNFENAEDTAELMDASPDTRDGESIIIATHRRSVRAYTINGLEIGFVRPIDETRLNQNFVYSGPTEAFNYIRNNISFVNIRVGVNNFTSSVPDQLSLRTLIADGEGSVYGLFGYRYIYNYILPIYENGVFVLPSTDDIGTIISDISRCC